jgi:exodeoxyribonuclease VII small subunit
MNQPTFEEAYERLEQILEKMNEGSIPLEDALKLYEEADALLKLCQDKLSSAEQKVEYLIKQRNAELAFDEQGAPKVAPFQPVTNR